ncbi:MAG: sigma-70 family RNA polymerase sigma factor [Anaerolineales bacterium]|nr:sigma-70 family RNA polymerase sigma factor [Anaerolineales bacterium]
MHDEHYLLRRARQLDEGALGQIYDAYSNELYAYAMRLLGDPERSEECVAETFSRFLKALSRGGGPQNFLRAYLYRVAHNWVVDDYQRHAALSLEGDMPGVVDPSPGPQASLDMHLEQNLLRQALFRLTADQRQVIVLKYLQGMDNEEIAQSVNKPVGAVKSLQHRALASLRRMLHEERKR